MTRILIFLSSGWVKIRESIICMESDVIGCYVPNESSCHIFFPTSLKILYRHMLCGRTTQILLNMNFPLSLPKILSTHNAFLSLYIMDLEMKYPIL